MDIIEKVKAVLDTDVSAYELEKKTGVSRPTIVNMRKKKETLDYNKMQLQTAINLSQYYDSLSQSSQIFLDQGGYITFTTNFDRWMKEAEKITMTSANSSENKAMQVVIEKLKESILDNPDRLKDLYEIYKSALIENGKDLPG